MTDQPDCARDAQPHKLGSALLRPLGVASAALLLTILTALAGPLEAVASFPMACSGVHERPGRPLACRLDPADAGMAGARAHLARNDLESAEHEVQAMRRT